MPRAALFDMDRTLIRKETASLYVRYQREHGQASLFDLARVLYWVGQYTLGIVDAPAIARKALVTYVGVDESVMAARCEDFFATYVEKHVTDLGRAAVERHRAQGDVLAIVTGATPYVANPLAQRLSIPHVVSSELELDEHHRFTGRAVDPLCLGEGKVVRTERLAKELDFRIEEATFYSDSLTDLPLLERVKEPIAVNPDPRLTRIAQKRGWKIERW